MPRKKDGNNLQGNKKAVPETEKKRAAAIDAAQVITKLHHKIEEKNLTHAQLSRDLNVNIKTVSKWLTPEESSLSLENFILLCSELDTSPEYFFPDPPQIETFDKQGDPLQAESLLLDLERNIPSGRCKRVIVPLFSSVLELPELTERFLDKGFYKIKFGKTNIRQAFRDLRKQRKEVFENHKYRLQQLGMRDEFENWVKGYRLFRDIPLKNKCAQLEHLIKCLDNYTLQGVPRLEMRLTKSFFRSHYALYDGPDGQFPVTVLNTNNSYLYLKQPDANQLYYNEFWDLWENGTYEQLRHKDQWIEFLEKTMAFIEDAGKQTTKKKREQALAEYSVKELLGQE